MSDQGLNKAPRRMIEMNDVVKSMKRVVEIEILQKGNGLFKTAVGADEGRNDKEKYEKLYNGRQAKILIFEFFPYDRYA
jgi:hypothetical protein